RNSSRNGDGSRNRPACHVDWCDRPERPAPPASQSQSASLAGASVRVAGQRFASVVPRVSFGNSFLIMVCPCSDASIPPEQTIRQGNDGPVTLAFGGGASPASVVPPQSPNCFLDISLIPVPARRGRPRPFQRQAFSARPKPRMGGVPVPQFRLDPNPC